MTRLIRARSCRGFSATTIWIVEQFGLAMMLRVLKSRSASRLTSGTTSGTSGSMRKCEVLSITTHPRAAALGAYFAEIAAGRLLGGQGHHLVDRELALGQDLQHLVADGTGGTDDGDLVAHDAGPS